MVKLDKKIGDKKMSFFFLNAKIRLLEKHWWDPRVAPQLPHVPFLSCQTTNRSKAYSLSLIHFTFLPLCFG
jgi:hypothetical protein